ncbi:MAG: DUF4911 domain-containing protein [Nitrospirae bacterium]|nr:DUF4911 domain-containing protein [Nitrospirota bacterium]
MNRASDTVEMLVKIKTEDMAYFNFTIDAYEGLSSVRTVDAKQGIIKVTIPIAFAEDIKLLLSALKQDFGCLEIIGEGIL